MSFVLFIDFNNVLGVEFRTRVSIWDGTFLDNSQFYLLHATSPGVTCYMLSGFCNSPLISIHITIWLSLLLYFLKDICLRQYYEFPFILGDLRHISARLMSIASTNCKSKTRAMIGRLKCIECVVGRKFL